MKAGSAVVVYIFVVRIYVYFFYGCLHNDGTHGREYLGTALYDSKDLQKVYFKILAGRSPDNLFR